MRSTKTVDSARHICGTCECRRSVKRERDCEATRDECERAILQKIDASTIAEAAKKRFSKDTRGALRRVKDGPAATPCTDWARKGCEKCRTKRVGDPHHIFCEKRDQFSTVQEGLLADELRADIRRYQSNMWTGAGSSSTAAAVCGDGAIPIAQQISTPPPTQPGSFCRGPRCHR